MGKEKWHEQKTFHPPGSFPNATDSPSLQQTIGICDAYYPH